MYMPLLNKGQLLRPTVLQRPLSHLQHSNHLQPNLSTALRFCAAGNAIQEMLAFQPQWFRETDVWDHHVAVAVAAPKLAVCVRVTRSFYTLVIDLDLFQVLHVVIDYHLATADDGDTSYLAGMEPAYVDVGRDLVRE